MLVWNQLKARSKPAPVSTSIMSDFTGKQNKTLSIFNIWHLQKLEMKKNNFLIYCGYLKYIKKTEGVVRTKVIFEQIQW